MKIKVVDRNGRHIGHLQDLALEGGASPPVIGCLGIRLLWTDRIGPIELVKTVEDLVVLIPWDQVAGIDRESVSLRCAHPDCPVRSAAGRVLIRRDILDKQMVDQDGNRIQRVDDVLLSARGPLLGIEGLEVSKGMLITSSSLRRYLDGLRRRHSSPHDSEVIPWEAVQRVDEDAIVIESMRPRLIRRRGDRW